MIKKALLVSVCGWMGLITVACNSQKKEAGGKGDPNYPDNAYRTGQALFDAKNPMRLIGRLDKPFLQSTDAFEKSGQYPAGTVFVERLVYYQDKWFLYYGCADSFVAVAVSDKQLSI